MENGNEIEPPRVRLTLRTWVGMAILTLVFANAGGAINKQSDLIVNNYNAIHSMHRDIYRLTNQVNELKALLEKTKGNEEVEKTQ